MLNPLISVIVPVYKVEKYLNQCVESIVNQTYRNLEIILIDDGSPDNCPALCDEWQARDERVKVIHKANGGVSSARNCGLDAATGEYIGFVDSDDMIPLDYYEFLYNNLIDYDADVSRCAHYYFDDSGFVNNCDEVVEQPFIIEGNNRIMADIKNSGNKSVVLWNKLFKRSVIGDTQFDETLSVGEDTVFLFNVYKNTEKMVCHDLPKYGYNIHDERSWSRNDYNYQASRSMKKIIDDPECPNEVCNRYFIFSTMALHDIVVNGFNYDFMILRNEIVTYSRILFLNYIKTKDKRNLYKLFLLRFMPKLYIKLISRKIK